MEEGPELPIQSPPRTRPGITTNAQQQQRPGSSQQRDSSSKTPLSPRSLRDARSRRSPPALSRAGSERQPGRAGKSKMRITPSAMPRSLLPVTERKSQEENKVDWRIKKDSDVDRWDVAPDGTSAGREGRQFTVANVGSSGRIYLRPTIRPANQRYPQPQFTFPMTPPGTAGLDPPSPERGAKTEDQQQPKQPQLDRNFLQGSHWTPSQVPSTPTTAPRKAYRLSDAGISPSPRPGHRRAMSDSTVPDVSIARESDPGGFKIVITHPGEEQRPKTLEDLDPNDTPFLRVSIPSWKLGTPRFTLQGTPVIRGSSYAPTEDLSSSRYSLMDLTPREAASRRESAGSRATELANVPQLHLHQLEMSDLVTPKVPRPFCMTYHSTYPVIEPAMFDALTFRPDCDDRAIVRYAPNTTAVTAATPPRLVAEITSPKFVDYELVSDFFLTFRAFLEPSDLLRMLVARLRWAVARDDEIGMVVRVRTFVALRHWILNYFMDDFVVDYNLRVMFCDLLNDFVDELSNDPRGRKVQLKILAELKKCWRRVCAQYWDSGDFDTSLGPDVPISPGGIAGHRNPSLDPSFWEQLGYDDGPPQLDGMLNHIRPAHEETNFYADVSRAGHIDSVALDNRPGTPENQEHPGEVFERAQTSPTSITSVDVVSCSFPTKTMRFAQPGTHYPLAAHPVDPSSMYANSDPIATTPRALTGKRVRPQLSQHKRNGSLTDSLRDHAAATEKLLHKNTEILMSLPYAGSLVRGAMFPPGQAFVEVPSPGLPSGGLSRQTTLFQPHPLESNKEKASAMSGQGMRRLLGSVRRALSTKGQGVSPTIGNFINISPIGPRGATTNRLPGTAIVPQAARPRMNGTRPPIRIDLLGAEVAEDFKKAVREDAAAEAAKHGYIMPAPPLPPPPPADTAAGDFMNYSAAHMEEDSLQIPPDNFGLRPISDTGITTGSKSIVIVDDTLPVDFPMMTGALPAVNSSVEAFAATFLPGGLDPTPPNTPPGNSMGTPRRSSYVLSQQVSRPSLSADPLPPFVPDLETLGAGSSPPRPSEDRSRPSEDITRPSIDQALHSPNLPPPLSWARGHTRHKSSRSYKSGRSYGRRRYASFSSGIVPRSTVRSFDATTYSEASVDVVSDIPMPQPLRVLRRRPGGDLRAVTNVGDLDPAPLRRSRSVGSLTTYTDSIRSSYIRSPVHDSSGFVDVMSSDYSRDRDETFSLGVIAEHNPKRQISLFSTHSSTKPVMRPSFEVEAQKLAQIPDDIDDDGGVESALLKLEGKFEKRSLKLSMQPPRRPADVSAVGASSIVTTASISTHPIDDALLREEKKDHRQIHVGDEDVLPEHFAHVPGAQVQLAGEEGGEPTSFLETSSANHPVAVEEEVRSFLSGGSGESYCSIPLLERGLTDDGRSKRATREWTNHSILQDDGPTPTEEVEELGSHHPSYEIVKKTDSMEKIQPGETVPRSPRRGTDVSFLEDESDNETDLSSELSADELDEEDEFGEHGYVPTRSNTVRSRLPAHPLGDPELEPLPPIPQPLRSHPPSPPMTLVQALQMSPETAHIPEVHDHQVWEEKPLPPTPDTAAPTEPYGQETGRPDPTGTLQALHGAPKSLGPDNARKFSVHLPFILAFDSDILAQQFTLIEKDALNEIDWKELIEMRWKNAENSDARSWVEFLRNSDARGVEVVIARFNIMVKWAVSEIVLTQDIEERARCIIKFIHIATHCRRYRNFATMSQIAIALTSNEVSRLLKTWSMVPPDDVRTLKELEALVSPTRNFYNLRAEMEGVGISNADMGCIPFVGIYTHDLLFNAQRPSEIASSPTTAPLVNFERCRCAASIVKTLLRLLEASTLYTFQPIEGVTERCLWMGALTDENIRKYSETLE